MENDVGFSRSEVCYKFPAIGGLLNTRVEDILPDLAIRQWHWGNFRSEIIISVETESRKVRGKGSAAEQPVSDCQIRNSDPILSGLKKEDRPLNRNCQLNRRDPNNFLNAGKRFARYSASQD